MLKKLQTVLSMLFIIGISVPAYATTYYVDFANGNDNNNGLTTTTAFKHAPGDPQATGIADSRILQAGDIVQFKAGVAYKGQVLLTRSGTSTNQIIYRGQGWGTGRATFNMENIRAYAFKGNADYVKISGFNFFHYSSSGSDYVIYPTTGASHWTIDNVVFAYVQNWNSIVIFPDKPCILLSNSVSNITITNSEFFANGKTIIRLRSTSYIVIKDNNFGGINRGSETGWFSVAIRGELSCNNIHIQDNKFHDGWQYGGDQVPELNHSPAFIHFYGVDATTNPHQIFIERNYFYNDKVFSTGTGTGSLEITTYVKNVYVRNNIFANACQYWGTQLLLSSHCSYIFIDNNTFIDRAYINGYGVNSIKVYLNSSPVGSNIKIRNNIFWNDANETGDDCVNFHGNGTFTGTIDHNAYFRSNSNKVNVFNDVVVSWSTWRGHGLDLHSNFYNLTEPVFVSMPPTGATTSSGDYSLKSNAVNLIDKGITLTGFNNSYNGLTRPQGAAWDIGAFEYAGSDIGPGNPPKILDAILFGKTEFLVTFSQEMDQLSLLNKDNYTIDNDMSVLSADVMPGNDRVLLTTSPGTPGVNYHLTVNNVKDAAGDLIDPMDNSAAFEYRSNSKYPVTSADAEWYQNFKPQNAIDGNSDPGSDSRWGGVLMMPDSMVFDLGKVYNIDETHFSFYRWDQGRTYNYSVMVSPDKITWTTVVDNQVSFLRKWTTDGFTQVQGRYIKLLILSSSESKFAGLWEAEFLGPDNVTGIVDNGIKSPSEFKLEQNYPNPFNPTTNIKFEIPSDQHVVIDVYNSIGQLVKTLVNQYYSSGSHVVTFNAANFASGIYIYRIEAGAFTESKKMILIK
jgi:hypothetical protein